MPRLLNVALLLLSVVCLAGPAGAASDYERGNTLEPATLDPQLATTPAEFNILYDLYEGLTTYDAAGAVIPGVAEGWTVADDGLVWRFTLRRTQWSNGDRVTATDFVRALRHLIYPQTSAPDAALYSAVVNADAVRAGNAAPESLGVKAIGEGVLEITLTEPLPYLPDLLARPSAMPTHSSGEPAKPSPGLVVNGPYQIASHVPGESLRLVANPFHRDAAELAIASVTYRPIEADVAVRRFEAGELLSNNNVPAFRLAALKERLGDALRVAPYFGSYFYALNTATPSLADVRVRRALSLAVDRERLSTLVWGGAMLPALSLVPSGLPSYGDPARAEAPPADPAERVAAAKALLAEAGYDEEKPLSLTLTVAASQLNRMTAAAVVADWAAAGVKAKVVEVEAAQHYRDLKAGANFEVASIAWIADFNDALTFLDLLRGEAGEPGVVRYAEPEFAAVLDEAAKTGDRAVRSALLFKAERLAMRDMPIVPLLQYGSINLVSPRLVGWRDNVLDVHPTRWLSIAAEDGGD